MNDKIIRLTNSVYTVLEFFPESDPLKSRAKDKALAVMDNLMMLNETSGWASFQKEKTKANILEDIDMLLGYLWIAKSQGWLNSVNYLIISHGYEKLKKEVEPVMELTQKLPGLDSVSRDVAKEESSDETPKAVAESVVTITETDKESAPVFFDNQAEATATFPISERQEKILDFIIKNGRAQVMDLQTVLGDVTKRTIRRDLDELLLMDRIVRMGEFNQVFYKIK